jgi:hypothetical protein
MSSSTDHRLETRFSQILGLLHFYRLAIGALNQVLQPSKHGALSNSVWECNFALIWWYAPCLAHK